MMFSEVTFDTSKYTVHVRDSYSHFQHDLYVFVFNNVIISLCPDNDPLKMAFCI